MEAQHISVLLNECLELLDCRKGGIYVDATLGHAGHAAELLKRSPEIGLLVGIDQDREAVQRAAKTLERYPGKVRVLQGNFSNLKRILAEAGIGGIDGILFDLGVSTSQLKEPSRGFSFSLEGPLDMRMNQNSVLRARDVLKQLSARELEHVLRKYGEERWAKRIAGRIKSHLEQHPIETTSQLSEIVKASIPAKYRPRKIHPATKTFQALRLYVNGELEALEQGLDDAMALLNPGGRLCVISFHSLEDRIVKNKFKGWSGGCTCPPHMPVCTCGRQQWVKVLTRKPLLPSEAEVAHNPSARSAKLRAAEKVAVH